MRLVHICDSERENERVAFEVINDQTTAFRGRQFIVVNLNEKDPELLFKKELLVRYLVRVSDSDRAIDWRELDNEIAGIMNARIHSI